MSHESLPSRPESAGSRITSAEAKGHNERLKEKIETNVEKAGNKPTAEQEARHEVYEKAISVAEYNSSSGEDVTVAEPVAKTKQGNKLSFNTTMHHARKNMKPVERSFSKVIHQPIVEKTSEVIGKTVARPSGLIGAGIASFIGLLFIFGIAKYAGFQLSGSEMPLLLLIGLVSGLLIEWTVKSIRSVISSRG